jgi:cytochrome P450
VFARTRDDIRLTTSGSQALYTDPAMPASTEIPSQALWIHDRPDSPVSQVAEPPYFDTTLNAWVFSRYADIVSALRSPSLIPASLTKANTSEKHGGEEHQEMRAETLAALSASDLRLWKDQLVRHSEQLVQSLPEDKSVDLLGEYVCPLCLSLASTVTHLRHDNPSELCKYARASSAFAADPYNSSLRAPAKSATAQLRPFFPPGPESLRSSGFVALTQTMPALLGNAWFALLQRPRKWRRLHLHPDRTEQAMEELIRYSGFTRILTRLATIDMSVNGTEIRKGQRILLRLNSGNRDPESFPHPERIDLTRRGATHLAFGMGPHACVGAGLLRMIAVAITVPLLSRFTSAQLVRNVEWQGGATFVSPQSLWVQLHC